MTAKSSPTPSPDARSSHDDLAFNLHKLAAAVDADAPDGDRNPGRIAADDAGASRWAVQLDPPRRDKPKTPTDR